VFLWSLSKKQQEPHFGKLRAGVLGFVAPLDKLKSVSSVRQVHDEARARHGAAQPNGRGGDVLVDSQVSQVLFDLGGAHFDGMAFIMEEDKALAPLDIGFFGADRVMFSRKQMF
jgi:hypothetical protein